MEIVLDIVFLILFLIAYLSLNQRVKSLWNSAKYHNETMMRVIDENEKIINAIPQTKKNLTDTKTILDLAKKQQLQIASEREQTIALRAQLQEALDTLSYLGGQMKPDEALKYLRFAKEKYGQEFQRVVQGVEMTISDSHTDNP